jgi:hypothetical protein
MSATPEKRLSNTEMEILRALSCGLELQYVEGDWRFVGQWQDRRSSRVDPEIVARLLRSGLICSGTEYRNAITAGGEKMLSQYLEEVISGALNRSSGRGWGRAT